MAIRIRRRFPLAFAAACAFVLFFTHAAAASEADLVLPDLNLVDFHGFSGRALLFSGIAICVAGLAFGLVIYKHLKNLPVHKSMLEVSELIYEMCKTYLRTQGKFILVLWVFIAVIMVAYFGFLSGGHEKAGTGVIETTAAAHPRSTPLKVGIILLFSLIGIAGSYSVAWFGIRINTFANSRTALASLGGRPFP